ncbi:lipocalin family protein [Aureispira sp. CCB-E]|uniref:lipocalin family protein n=1 Tax=Aureispira sp. CCB-E TaxID=3051121 RepID=UPI0028684503|nr:lipocalin family protein [Aureispira sp. CCB-E]WMX12926.1 lipocalin family protein [Aureispira sp. CCB-E]
MKINLQDLEGRWYINQSNFPMWLKGNKANPTFNYTLQEKKGQKGLLDIVQYQQNGKTKSIKGYDTVLDANNRKFMWRGKGLLAMLTSKWEILHLAPDQSWAIIYFQKTLFTPNGYDVISRQKKLSLAQEQAIDTQLKQLNISTNLVTIQQSLLSEKHQ